MPSSGKGRRDDEIHATAIRARLMELARTRRLEQLGDAGTMPCS